MKSPWEALVIARVARRITDLTGCAQCLGDIISSYVDIDEWCQLSPSDLTDLRGKLGSLPIRRYGWWPAGELHDTLNLGLFVGTILSYHAHVALRGIGIACSRKFNVMWIYVDHVRTTGRDREVEIWESCRHQEVAGFPRPSPISTAKASELGAMVVVDKLANLPQYEFSCFSTKKRGRARRRRPAPQIMWFLNNPAVYLESPSLVQQKTSFSPEPRWPNIGRVQH